MDSEDGPDRTNDIQRLLNRVNEIQQTHDRLMRELHDSIEASSHVLKEIEDRGRS